jgi:hypothetical protein
MEISRFAPSVLQTAVMMYVGGMAGTGKSQVIEALMDFF